VFGVGQNIVRGLPPIPLLSSPLLLSKENFKFVVDDSLNENKPFHPYINLA
jgi:hypothetical protein